MEDIEREARRAFSRAARALERLRAGLCVSHRAAVTLWQLGYVSPAAMTRFERTYGCGAVRLRYKLVARG